MRDQKDMTTECNICSQSWNVCSTEAKKNKLQMTCLEQLDKNNLVD